MARFIGRKSASFVELSGQQGRVSTIAVVLAEKGDSRIRWDLQIDATTLERGTTRVGRVLSIPPSYFVGLPGAAAQRSASRVVAIATCANATSWKVTGVPRLSDIAPGDDEPIADCTITAVHAPVSVDGVAPVYADVTGIEHADGVAFQVGLNPGVPTLIAPYSADRARLVVSCPDTPAVPLAIGFSPSVLLQNYFVIPAGQTFDTETRRPVWALSIAGANASVWTEGY